MIVEKFILSGIRRKYLQTYLESICESSKEGKKFLGEGWEIELHAEKKKKAGIVQLTQTQIFFRGELATIDPIIYKFRMEFLSAGG